MCLPDVQHSGSASCRSKNIASVAISLPLLTSPFHFHQSVLSHPLSLSHFPISTSLLQRNKPRTVRRANTGPSVLDRLVTDAELAQIEPHHLRLDLDLVELLA
jgi:hypothetical protein